jgi:hypothetical protein
LWKIEHQPEQEHRARHDYAHLLIKRKFLHSHDVLEASGGSYN